MIPGSPWALSNIRGCMLGALNGGQAARLDFADAGDKFCPIICTTGVYRKVILLVKLLQAPSVSQL